MTSLTPGLRTPRAVRVAAAFVVAVVTIALIGLASTLGAGRAVEAACSPAGFTYSSLNASLAPPGLDCEGEWWTPGHAAGTVVIDRTGDLVSGLVAVAIVDLILLGLGVLAARPLLRRPRDDSGRR